MIADDFYPLATPRCNYTRNYTDVQRAAGLNREKLDTYKPEDFKPGFEEKIRFLRFFKKIFLKLDNCLILRLSIATQLSTNLLFAWNQFSFLDEQRNRYKSMESVKTRKIDKQNECVIDIYQLINTTDIDQIRFTDFYRLINWYRFLTIAL